MSLVFASIAASLAGGITLWLCSVLWRGHRPDKGIAHHAVNATVLRDQLAELEQDVANQTLSRHDLSSAKQELQQRVLQEAAPGPVPTPQGHNAKRTAAALALVLPIATILLYFYLGNPATTLPSPASSAPAITQTDVENMMKSLETHLAEKPADLEGWLMLGRAYRYVGKYTGAAHAFSKAAPLVQTDALTLAEYAEVLARSSGTGFTDEAMLLLKRALTINPREPFALTLAGTAAFENGHYQAAIDYWQQLLELLPPGTEATQTIADGIERAQREINGVNSP